ncbi:MAG: hypothetical protein AAFP19_23900 [Bacteroidota bacterium]
MRKITLLTLSMLAFAWFFTACNTDTPSQTEEKSIDESVENIGEELENIGDEIGQELESISEELQEKLNRVAEDAGEDAQDVSIELGDNFEEALSKVGKALDDLKDNEGKKVDPINFRDLQKLAPRRISGMKQSDDSGQTTGVLGFKISTSKVVYEDGAKKIELNIADTGGLGLAVSKMADWSTLEVDKESRDGYERTFDYKGHKAYEKYDSKRDRGEFKMIVADRFVVSLDGWDVEEGELKKAIRRIDIDDLEDMAAN